MVNEKVDGKKKKKNRMFDFCEETGEHVDMFFQENCGESMCNFIYWEEE